MAELSRILVAFILQLCEISYFILDDLLRNVTIILMFSSIILIFIVIHLNFTYWKRRGVKQNCTIPFKDDMTRKFLEKRPLGDMVMEIYNRFRGTRCVGFYQFFKPILMLKDPELIEFVCDDNFHLFQNHTHLVPLSNDRLWNKSLYALKGQCWFRARSHLKPMFVDKRRKNLLDLTRSYAYNFTNSLVQTDRNVLEANFKELFAKYTTEIMARSVYDLQNKPVRNANSMFYTKMRDSCEDFGTWQIVKILLTQTFPCMGKVLGTHVFDKNLSNFFREITLKIMHHREKFGIERQDLLSLLMTLRSKEMDNHLINTILKFEPGTKISNKSIEKDMVKNGIDLTEETIVAQAMSFFYFGYDIMPTVLCFLFYELAQNPTIQTNLVRELDMKRAHHEVIPFSDLFNVEYLSMVISETLRKWPPFYFTERVCNKTLTLSKKFPNEKYIKITAGDTVWIPIWALHRDPKYWWQPEVFNPERFRSSEHHKIRSHTFLPFGSGPRRCAAIDLAIMQLKIIVSEILTIFEVVQVRRTAKKILLDHRTFNLSPQEGIWLGLKKRFM